MNVQTTPSTEADTLAVAAVERHHALMAATLSGLVDHLVSDVSQGSATTAASRHALVRWCRAELVPHALAEERTMYPAAHAIEAGRLLVDGMLEEHKVIVALVDEVENAAGAVAAAGAAKALATMFDNHLRKENDLVLPLLAAADDLSLADLVGGMHELLGAHDEGHEQRRPGHHGQDAHHPPAG